MLNLQAKQTIDIFLENKIKVILTVILPIFLISILIGIWFYIEKRSNIKATKKYIDELSFIERTKDSDKSKYIEKFFKESKNSIYKVLFGIKLMNTIQKTDHKKAINIGKQMLAMPGLPSYISDLIFIKLAYIYVDYFSKFSIPEKDVTINSVIDYLKKNNSRTSFYAIKTEPIFEMEIINNNEEEYIRQMLAIQNENKNIPSGMSARILELNKG